MSKSEDQFKDRSREEVERVREQLIELSATLHSDPELGWQEVRSSQRVADVLGQAGFFLTQPFCGFETAFHAVLGPNGDVPPGLRVALMAEYDALPGLGHACGHNLIAASSVGAAIGLSVLVDALNMEVNVFGTPAEEGGGGKIELLDAGAFEGMDLAMMVHPGPVDVARASPLAVSHWSVEYRGAAAHASAFPTEGINAADAFTLAQIGIGLLRQQLPDTSRVHGVVLDAGTAPNSIPETARGRWYVRAKNLSELEAIEKRVMACFEAGALATGCELHIEPESRPYADFQSDEAATRLYELNATALGRVFEPETPGARMASASTDMGNVSQQVPSIHPYIGLGCYPTLNHQREFADCTIGPVAEKALLDGATALSWTAIDRALSGF